MKHLIMIFAALVLAACGGGGDRPRPGRLAPAETSTRISGWEIGPIVAGRNYSQGLPVQADDNGDGSFSFAIGPEQEPHYVTRAVSSFAGVTRLRLDYTLELPEGAEAYGAPGPTGACIPAGPSLVTLYLEAQNANWSGDGGRWWATFSPVPLKPGSGTVVADLDGPWTSVSTMTAVTHPESFVRAKATPGRVGFTFANCTGYGHGARATAQGRFTYRLTLETAPPEPLPTPAGERG